MPAIWKVIAVADDDMNPAIATYLRLVLKAGHSTSIAA